MVGISFYFSMYHWYFNEQLWFRIEMLWDYYLMVQNFDGMYRNRIIIYLIQNLYEQKIPVCERAKGLNSHN